MKLCAGWPPDARASRDPAVLDLIRRPGINLVVWLRKPSVELAAALDSFGSHTLKSYGFTPYPADIRPGVRIYRSGPISQETPKWRNPVMADVRSSVLRFNQAVGFEHSFARFDFSRGMISNEPFHLDQVPRYRALVAYRGLGSEWIPRKYTDYRAYRGGRADDICRDRRYLRQIPTLAVAIMKGQGSLSSRREVLMHRTPAGMYGTERALLVAQADPF